MDSPQQAEHDSRARWTARLALLAAAAIGLGAGLHYARLGYMPLDQSIAFDGGWRVLCGQVPLRDYFAPNGFPMHAVQALFFALFGVNWLALCLHAALVNAAACALAQSLLTRAGLRPAKALAFSAATAFVFSPPFGTPYMETHAFLFCLAALSAAWSACAGRTARVRNAASFALGPLLALAYLDKQIPSVFFLPLCLAFSAFAPHGRWRALARMLLSLAVTATALLAGAWMLGIEARDADLYLRQLPAEEGARRIDYVPDLASLLRRFEETREQLGLWSIAAVHALGLPALLAALLLARRWWGRSDWPWARPLGAAVLAQALLLACLGFIALTSNDKELGVPLVFLASGLAAAALEGAGRALGPRAQRVGALAGLALAVFALRDAWRFDRNVNATRKVNDIVFDAAAAELAGAELPQAWHPLRWATPRLVSYGAADVSALSSHLAQRPGAFWLIGDAAVLYGACGKPSVLPALWFHPGLTFPLPGDARFEAFEARLIENFERYDVRTVVIEPRVWIGYRAAPGETPKARYVTLETFPRVAQLVSERLANERSFGPIRVLELR